MGYISILELFFNPAVIFSSILFGCTFLFFSHFYDKTLGNFNNRKLVAPGLRCSDWDLTAGGHSNKYFDIDKATNSFRNIDNYIDWYISNIKEINEDSPIDLLAFIERESGPVGAITKKDFISKACSIDSFIVRPRKRIKAAAIKDGWQIEGKNILIMTDAVTTGASFERVKSIIEDDFGGKVIGAVSVVNRGGDEMLKYFAERGMLLKSSMELH